MRKLTLLIDCDEVLRDSVGEVVKVYNRIHKTDHKFSEIKEWKLSKCLPGFNEETFFIEYGKECFLDAEPYKEAKEVLKRLYKKYKIVIVSAQYPGNEVHTLNWFKKNNIPYHEIVFTKDKNSVEGDIIIDDKIGNLKKCIGSKICVCRSHKWNKDWKGLRANNLLEFEKLLKRFENND